MRSRAGSPALAAHSRTVVTTDSAAHPVVARLAPECGLPSAGQRGGGDFGIAFSGAGGVGAVLNGYGTVANALRATQLGRNVGILRLPLGGLSEIAIAHVVHRGRRAALDL